MYHQRVLMAGMRITALKNVQKTCMVNFVVRNVLLIATLLVITNMAAKVNFYSIDNYLYKISEYY